MCNAWCIDFARTILPGLGRRQRALEVGSRDVNGSLRNVLADNVCDYLGVDLSEGPGVDLVLNASQILATFGPDAFDLVISTEMLEHCYDWQDALYQMLAVLEPGGVLILTTRSPGFELHDYPADHWRFTRDDFRQIFSSVGDILALDDDMTLGWPCGVGVILRKTGSGEELREWRQTLMSREIYAMADENRQSATASAENNGTLIIFDQFSRYTACAQLLNYAGESESQTILDVGSGPECLLGRFLPTSRITYVDPLVTPSADGSRIHGDVFAPELDGTRFACVTATDVLEHVPPESRHRFLERLSNLAEHAIVLGFPASENPAAQATDDAVNEAFHSTYGVDYPWLAEHRQYGLPSLAQTRQVLEHLGWHCQTVGHGHAPWLQKLLSLVVCIWEISQLKAVVLSASECFNRELAGSDFAPPHYREFLIATRDVRPPWLPPASSTDMDAVEASFTALLAKTKEDAFAISLRELAAVSVERNVEKLKVAIAERDTALAERDLARAEHEAAESARNVAEQSRAETAAELAKIKGSRSWRLVHYISVARWIATHRTLSDHDRMRIKEILRGSLRKLPSPVKNTLKWAYAKAVIAPSRSAQRRALAGTPFQPPPGETAPQRDALPDYVVWGVIDWHLRLQRPQHLAKELANTGRRVFYVSAHLVDDARPGFDVEPLDDSGRLFQIRLYAEGAPVIYSSAPGVETIRQLRASTGELLQWADTQQLVSLIQHPFWHDIATVLPNCRTVYDCMDHHEGFGNTSPDILSLERALVQNCGLTVTTSAYLDQIVSTDARRRTIIRNAAEFEHFSSSPATVYRDPLGRKVIGYYGAIAEWFDQELIAAIATQFQECCILLIGADTAGAQAALGRLPNVQFVGEVPYTELPYYLYALDVCLLPFKVIPLTLATNPVKVYEYLSAGKQVVAVDLPEMRQFGDLIKVADDKETYLAQVASALEGEDSPDAIDRRREFARNQTWKHRAEALMRHAESAEDDPKVSIIVVTYNNVDLTKACLASIDAHTDYPNLEVIVVDNASTDGSRDFLTEWAKAGRNRTLILNEDNRGFAAANNQGLAAASGDYLVLLNNDTYVTPGWVRTLLRHLQRDGNIGLVGPVTNNIGNEARIEIDYGDMAQMLAAASRYTRSHIGQTIPLRTAAFFCVMFPRNTYARVGTLDEAFGRGFFEDDDYCRRIEQLGHRIVCAEDVFIHHHLSASFNRLGDGERRALFEQNKMTYEAKWGTWVPHKYERDARQ